MGVLACDRNGCTNIMCTKGNNEYYICDECFKELLEMPWTDIDEFMDSPKRKTDPVKKGKWEEYLNKLFNGGE